MEFKTKTINEISLNYVKIGHTSVLRDGFVNAVSYFGGGNCDISEEYAIEWLKKHALAWVCSLINNKPND